MATACDGGATALAQVGEGWLGGVSLHSSKASWPCLQVVLPHGDAGHCVWYDGQDEHDSQKMSSDPKASPPGDAAHVSGGKIPQLTVPVRSLPSSPGHTASKQSHLTAE